MSDDAVEYKSRGNELFRATRFEEASEMYRKAEYADPSNAVYPSNLSAALYEAGHYKDSAEAILRSWKLICLSNDAKPDLAARLFTRLAKSLAHGFLGGQIADEFLTEHDYDIMRMKNASLKPSSEAEKAWNLWDAVHHGKTDKESREKAVSEAMREFWKLPQRRQAQEPYLEYFVLGTDPIFSVLDGWSDNEKCPLDLQALPEPRLSNVALLFGGVGDARHVFGTLISLHDVYEKMTKRKKKALHVHMTMLDIHPAILARDLCILMLLHQLTDDTLDPEARMEIEATIAYTYYALLLPPYSAKRLKNVMENLIVQLSESPPDLPEWLYVTNNSIAPIIEVLSMWLDTRRDPMHKSTAYLVNAWDYKTEQPEEAADRMNELANLHEDSLIAKGWKSRQNSRTAMEQFVDSCSAEFLVQLGVVRPNASPVEIERARKDNREKLVEVLTELQNHLDKKEKPLEDAWLKRMKVFLPPRSLWSRHPGFEELVKQLSKGGMKNAKVKQVEAHIMDDWKPNDTVFYNEYFDPGCRGGFEELALDPFSFADTAYSFLRKHKTLQRTTIAVPTVDRQMIDTLATFFRAVADALKALDSRVKLEILNGPLNNEMSKIRLKGDSSRPAEFPKSFVRMWLTNIPYSLMTLKEVPKFFGLKVICDTIVMGVMCVKREPLPRPLSTLASRQELYTWLTRVLFQILMPGKTLPAPSRVLLPNNVHAFVQMLIHLSSVGFPGHWLAEYLQDILSGTVESDLVPYQDFYPIPLEEKHKRVRMRKVRLDPWIPDFENAIALVREAFPFAVTLPSSFQRPPSDIVLWKANIVRDMMMDFTSRYSAHIHSPTDPVMNLLVFKGEHTGEVVLEKHQNVFEGASKPEPGRYFIITGIEMYDIDEKGEVRWRMSRERVSKMKQEGDWYILPIRTDNFLPVADDVFVRKWVEVVE
ncbi:hypothetical protein EIP86_001620 [Pleurotus ostreatoroseus]|nr:hypothetical protein EIP86_001620 [Pleurotus ostreatoroseus]